MSKKNVEQEIVDEIGLSQEPTTAPLVEEVVAETKETPTYPRIPKDEGVDPLTAGPKILNTEPNNQA